MSYVQGTMTLRRWSRVSKTWRAAVLPLIFARLRISLGSVRRLEDFANVVKPATLAVVQSLAISIPSHFDREFHGILWAGNAPAQIQILESVFSHLISLKRLDIHLAAKEHWQRLLSDDLTGLQSFFLYRGLVNLYESAFEGRTQLSLKLTVWDKDPREQVYTGSSDWKRLHSWSGLIQPVIHVAYQAHPADFETTSAEREVLPKRHPAYTVCAFIRPQRFPNLANLKTYGQIRRMTVQLHLPESHRWSMAGIEACAGTLESLTVVAPSPHHARLNNQDVVFPKLRHLNLRQSNPYSSVFLLHHFQCPNLRGLEVYICPNRPFADAVYRLCGNHGIVAYCRKSPELQVLCLQVESSLADWEHISRIIGQIKEVLDQRASTCRLDVEYSNLSTSGEPEQGDAFNGTTPLALCRSITQVSFRIGDFSSWWLDPEAPAKVYASVQTVTFLIDDTKVALHRVIAYIFQTHHLPALRQINLQIRVHLYESDLLAVVMATRFFPRLVEIVVDTEVNGKPVACPPSFVELCSQRGVAARDAKHLEQIRDMSAQIR